MSAHCCEHEPPKPSQIANLGHYRRILWVALVVNAAMFAVEIVAGIQAGSLALLADAICARRRRELASIALVHLRNTSHCQ